MPWTLREVMSRSLSRSALPIPSYALLQSLYECGLSPESMEREIRAWVDQGTLGTEPREEEGEILVQFSGSPPEPPARDEVLARVRALSSKAFLIFDCLRTRGPSPLPDVSQMAFTLGSPPQKWREAVAPLAEALHSGLVDLRIDQGGASLAVSLPGLPPDACALCGSRFEEEYARSREELIRFIASHCEIAEGSPLLDAFRRVDRRWFVPPDRAHWAACDHPVTIAEEMTTSAPTAVAGTLKPLLPAPGERVLICGVKAGYTAVLAAQMVGGQGKVVCLDPSEEVAAFARANIARFAGCRDVVEVIRQEDVTIGYEHKYPWHVILLNGSIPNIPYELIGQLDGERGRLMFFLQDPRAVSDNRMWQTCYVVHKNQNVLKEEELSGVSYTPLFGEYGWKRISSMQDQYEQTRELQRRNRATITNIQTKTPYPLAKMFTAAQGCTDGSERFTAVIKAYEVLLKYMAIPCVTIFDRTGRKSARFSEHVANLTGKPSMGQWLGALHDVSGLVEDSAVGRALSRDLLTDLADETLREAHRYLEIHTGKRDAGLKAHVKLTEFLTKVVQFRNKSGVAHGPMTRSKETEKSADVLLEALMTILPNLSVSRNFDVVCYESVNIQPDESYLVTARIFSGCNPHWTRWTVDGKSSKPLPGVYLLAKDRSIAAVLSPWFVYAVGNMEEVGKDLFLFSEKNLYLTGFDPNYYPPKKECEDIDALKARHAVSAKKTLDPETVKNVLEGLLSTVVKDGIVSRDEMALLATNLVALGVSEDTASAEDYLRNLIADKHAGVFVEGPPSPPPA